MTENCYYVYYHRRLTDGSIFYVGKGKGRRSKITHKRNKFWQAVANKHGFYVDELCSELSESDAFSLEISEISRLKGSGVRLTNITDGGEGGSGAPGYWKGKRRPKETVEKMRKALTGRKVDPEIYRKRSEKMSGSGHPRYNAALIDFENIITGETLRLTLHDFCLKTGSQKSNAWSMVYGRLSSCNFWTVKGMRGKNPRLVNIFYRFYHCDFGEVVCTQSDLCRRHNLKMPNLSKVCNGQRKSCGGWKVIEAIHGPGITSSH